MEEKTYKPGDIVTVGGIEFVILDEVSSLADDEPKYFALAREIQFSSPFDEGDCNNYAQSDLRKRVDEWLGELTGRLNEEYGCERPYIINRSVDLMTLDGYKGFGVIEAGAAPLTLDERRKYAEIIPDPDEAEWLATGWGGPGKLGTDSVFCVDSSGGWGDYNAYYTYGVRPALILPSGLLSSHKDEVDLRSVSCGDLLAELTRRIAPEKWCGEKAASE